MSCNVEHNLKTQTISKGESIEYSWAIDDGALLTDWICYVQVRFESTGDLTSIDREVTNKNQEDTLFIENFTKTDTDSLREGNYIVGFEFENTVTGQCAEAIERLTITKSWVNRP